MLAKALIIGAGELGQAMAQLLERSQKVEVLLYDTDQERNRLATSLTDAAQESALVLFCAPATALRSAISSLTTLPSTSLVISLAKGVELESGYTTDTVLPQALPGDQSYALFSGPLLANELNTPLPLSGAAVVASPTPDCYLALRELLPDSIFLTSSPDLRGVAIAGVLKNIYALLTGMASSAGFGCNALGWLVTEAANELSRLLPRLGGQAKTACGTAGVADLIATAFSPHSHNVRAGKELAEKGTLPKQSEGYQALPFLREQLGFELSGYPVLKCAIRLGLDKLPVREGFTELLNAARDT